MARVSADRREYFGDYRFHHFWSRRSQARHCRTDHCAHRHLIQVVLRHGRENKRMGGFKQASSKAGDPAETRSHHRRCDELCSAARRRNSAGQIGDTDDIVQSAQSTARAGGISRVHPSPASAQRKLGDQSV